MNESHIAADVLVALPEIWLAVAAMALLMFGVFRKAESTDIVNSASVLVLAVTAGLVIFGSEGRELAFHGAFVVDAVNLVGDADRRAGEVPSDPLPPVHFAGRRLDAGDDARACCARDAGQAPARTAALGARGSWQDAEVDAVDGDSAPAARDSRP